MGAHDDQIGATHPRLVEDRADRVAFLDRRREGNAGRCERLAVASRFLDYLLSRRGVQLDRRGVLGQYRGRCDQLDDVQQVDRRLVPFGDPGGVLYGAPREA